MVPTRDERESAANLIADLERATEGLSVEIVSVDDGQALGEAVTEGLRRARGAWVCVVTGEWQRAPALIPDALGYAQEADTDLVLVGQRPLTTRDAAHGRARRTLPLALGAAANIVFPRSRWGLSDPLSGFFLVRREALAFYSAHDHGLRSLLAILTRRLDVRVAEISPDLGSRQARRRIVSPAEALTYLLLLWYYRFGDDARCFSMFLVVGASSLLINSLVMALGKDVIGLHYLAAAVLAAQSATLWSFQLVEFWVFPDRRPRHGRVRRFIRFLAMNNVALALRGPVLYALTSGLGVHYLLSNAASILAFTVVRYSLSSLWIWAR